MVGRSDDEAWRARLVAATSELAPSDALSVVVEEAPDAMSVSRAVRDEDGAVVDIRLLYLNRTARALQPDPEAAVGRLGSELWPDMATNGSAAACRAALSTGLTQAGGFTWTDDRTFSAATYDYRAVRLGTDLLLWVLRDVTARVDADHHLAIQRGALEDALVELRRAQEALTAQQAAVYDEVVQALTAAKLALELGEPPELTLGALMRAMDAAKRLSDRPPEPAGVGPSAEATTGGGGPSPGGDAARPARVLICDDDPLIRRLLSRTLTLAGGFEVVGDAPDGRRAVAAASALQPDLVMLDINMPVMSGMEALPLIRAAAPNTLVVVISGQLEADAAAQATRAGAAAYLEKGVSIEQVVEAARSALLSRRP